MPGRIYTTVTLNEFGSAREVEIYYFSRDGLVGNYNAWTSDNRLFSARLGRGAKLHPRGLTLFPINPLYGLLRGNTRVVAADGTEWQYNKGCTILNSASGKIVAWADVAVPTSQHSGGRY